MKDTERTLKPRKRVIDPATTIIPFAIILTLCLFFVIKPERSTIVIGAIRGFLGNQCGLYYLVAGLGILLLSFYIAFSDIGKIKLGGKDEKPKYNFYMRACGRYSFLFLLRVDLLCTGTACRRAWRYSDMGTYNADFSLGSDSMEFLCSPCSSVRVYASCKRSHKTKIFGSL